MALRTERLALGRRTPLPTPQGGKGKRSRDAGKFVGAKYRELSSDGFYYLCATGA